MTPCGRKQASTSTTTLQGITQIIEKLQKSAAEVSDKGEKYEYNHIAKRHVPVVTGRSAERH